ncbi:hypothetical protein K8S17_02275 [bacterium]|nr:hypothetical protein [bacterium]
MTVRVGIGIRRAAAVTAVALLFVAASTATADLCPRVKYVALDDKTVEIGWTLGIDERDIDDFGGYRVWIREVWNSDDFGLFREYVWGETDTSAAGYWDFEPFYIDSVRVYRNTGLQNAFPYMLSVTAFEEGVSTVNEDCLEENASDVVSPRVGQQTKLSRIQVIPNPYRSSADWESGGDRRVAFVGLPGKATIRIYTIAGKLVRSLRHDHPDSDQESWDLKNSDGEEVAPGVYVWSADADGIGSVAGKMMIIK